MRVWNNQAKAYDIKPLTLHFQIYSNNRACQIRKLKGFEQKRVIPCANFTSQDVLQALHNIKEGAALVRTMTSHLREQRL